MRFIPTTSETKWEKYQEHAKVGNIRDAYISSKHAMSILLYVHGWTSWTYRALNQRNFDAASSIAKLIEIRDGEYAASRLFPCKGRLFLPR